MTNTASVLMYAPLLIISALLLCKIASKKEKLHVDRYYIILCALLIGWQILELLFYVVREPQQVEFVFSAKFVFLVFLPPAFLFLVAGFYHMDKRITLPMKLLLLVIPAVTAALAITSSEHEIFRRNFEVLTTEPLTTVSFDWGPWYPINLVNSQIPVVCIAAVFVTQYRKLPKDYRVTVNLLFFGFAVYIAGFLLEVFHLDGRNTLDFNLIAVCVSNVIFYIAVSSNGRADYLNIWRRDIFDYLDEAVLIADVSGVVVDANAAAMRLLGDIVPAIDGVRLDTFFDAAVAGGRVALREAGDAQGGAAGRDLYITNGPYPLVYNIRRQALPDTGRAGSGEFVSFTEVTENRLLIERLRETAGVDALTGLKNRYGYERALRELDTPENLPLSIIISDVNGLKQMNDAHGHDMGDELLRRVADILRACFSENDTIARIGGDEFVVLLARCSASAAADAIRRVEAAAREADGFPCAVSSALGSATKTAEHENLNRLFKRADARMYARKRGDDHD